MKKRLIAVLVLLSVAGFVCAETSNGRGFYFDIGVGGSAITYGSELDQQLAAVESSGAERTTINIGLTLGYALTDKLYFTGSISGVGDRFVLGANAMQLNSYLYGLGLKLYPFGTGLQLGLDLGKPAMVVQSNTSTNGAKG